MTEHERLLTRMGVILGPSSEPIPGYRLIERLGRGGFGEVWKAEAPGGLLKAIKFVFGDLNATGDGEPAEQELRSLERVKAIRHPYILSLERYDIVDGQLLIVMELADRNLWDRFRECRAQGLPGIPKPELLRYLAEAAEALDLMNTQYQLQHLDIKPQNLFLVYNHVKIADFGLVKDFEGKRGTITGGVTPVYAAPETFEGWVSRHSDQYSLAIVYQELVCGQRPFNGTTGRQLLLQHLQAEPDVSPLTVGDQAVVGRALAKKPDDRWPSCSEFIRALSESATNPAYATPSGAVPPPASSSGGSITSTPTGSASSTDHGTILHTPPERVGSRTTHARLPAPMTQPRPVAQSMPMSELPLPIPPVTESAGDETGVLVPAVILGLGGIGGRTLRLFKQALADRFPNQALPSLRLLAVDTDSAALRSLTGDPVCPLAPEEVFHTPLGRPSHYLRGELAGIETWLGASTLYRLPKQATSAELRAFGRLAFLDHAPALGRRIRAEIDAARNPAAVQLTDRVVKRGVRAARPRVYVIAGLAGGTGSGMFLDAAYLARAVLRQIELPDSSVHALLFIPDCERGGSGQAVSNAHAALTELHHFCQPHVRYEGRLLGRNGPVSDSGRPFQRVVVLPLSGSDGPDAASNQSLGQGSAVLYQELLTTVGRTADRERAEFEAAYGDDAVPLQSVATYRVTFPHDRLSAIAGRRLGRRLLKRWTEKAPDRFRSAVEAVLEDEWDLRGLTPEQLAESTHQKIAGQLGMPATDRIDSLIAPLVDLGRTPDKLTSAAVFEVVDSLVRLLGPPEGYLTEGPAGRVPQLFEKLGPEEAQRIDHQVAELTIQTVERPGLRIAGAEELVRQLGDKARQSMVSYQSLSESLWHEAGQVFRKLFPMIEGLERYAFTGKRREQHVQDVLTLLREYPKKQYQSLLAKCLFELYRGLVNALPEIDREVAFCRERLVETDRELIQQDSGAALMDVAHGPGRSLFPHGTNGVDEAAERVIDGLRPGDWDEIDLRVQAPIVDRFQSLVNFCLTSGPKPEHMAELLQKEGREYLRSRLAAGDPAEMLLDAVGQGNISDFLREAIEECYPHLGGPKSAVESLLTVFSAPDNAAGRELRRALHEVARDTRVVETENPDEIVVYREFRRVRLADLPLFGPLARDVYRAALAGGTAPPHSRLDIPWEPVGS